MNFFDLPVVVAGIMAVVVVAASFFASFPPILVFPDPKYVRNQNGHFCSRIFDFFVALFAWIWDARSRLKFFAT